MVNRNGFGIQSRRREGFRVSNFELQIARLRRSFLKLAPALPLCCLLFSGLLRAQMPAGTPTYNVNAKWVTDRGSQVYNVKAYGAKCDGVTDDSAAFAAAVAALPAGTALPTLNTVGGGTLFIPASHTPCNLASARLAITQSNVLVSGYGATLLCNVNDDCVTMGNLSNALAASGIVIRGLAIEPGTGSAGHSAIRDNAQGTVIRDITNITNYSEYPSYPGFNHFFENDNDQSESIEHVSLNGNYLVCNSTFCGSTLWEPGPVSTNAGITWLSDFNFDPECWGNGIDWLDGNDFHMKGGVIQGFNQFAVRVAGGITNKYASDQVHIEQGNCSNPLGNVGQAALILINATMSWHGGQLGAGLPQFPQAGTTGSTNYGYYIVGYGTAAGSSGYTSPLPAGFLTNGNATINSTNNVTVTWNDFGATSYDVLRYPRTYPGTPPSGTGNWAVATSLAESSVCTGGVCTFVDTVTSPSSYTIHMGGGYGPSVALWPGAVVVNCGASYYGDALSQGGDFINPCVNQVGAVTVFGQVTSYEYDPEPLSPQPVLNASFPYSLPANIPITVATGSTSMGTPTINAGTCASPVSITSGNAVNVLSTDVVEASFNSNPTSTVGFEPGAMLSIIPYAGSGSVNFILCNNTSSQIVAGAVTLNWRVTR